jgi:hypothetical protein
VHTGRSRRVLRLQEGSAIVNNACVRRKSIVEAVTRRAAARGNSDRDPERGEDDRAHDRDRSNGVEGFASHGLSESGTSIGRRRDDAKSGQAFAERGAPRRCRTGQEDNGQRRAGQQPSDPEPERDTQGDDRSGQDEGVDQPGDGSSLEHGRHRTKQHDRSASPKLLDLRRGHHEAIRSVDERECSDTSPHAASARRNGSRLRRPT